LTIASVALSGWFSAGADSKTMAVLRVHEIRDGVTSFSCRLFAQVQRDLWGEPFACDTRGQLR
jgi:hypothetical protein